VRIPWRTREYERTCDDCDYVWRVPKGIVHPQRRGLPMTPQALPMTRGAVAAGAAAVVEANAELAERAAAFRHCPECESDHYKQRPIRS